MPLLEIIKTCQITASIRLDETTAGHIDQYAAFLHASADEIVDKALAYVFTKDRDFQEFLRTPEAAHVPPSLRIRHIGQNGAPHENPKDAANRPHGSVMGSNPILTKRAAGME